MQLIYNSQTGQIRSAECYDFGTAFLNNKSYIGNKSYEDMMEELFGKYHCEIKKLAEDVKEKGYIYCDWNVSSGDGGGAKDEATVIQNVMNFSTGIRQAIVLQHDTQSFSVDAVDDIIRYARSKGYTLLPLTEDSPMVQQNPSN